MLTKKKKEIITMNKDVFLIQREQRGKSIKKYVIITIASVIFFIAWIGVGSFFLDEYFPDRSENPLPVWLSFVWQIGMMAPIIAIIGMGLKQFNNLMEYISISKARKPESIQNFSIELLEERAKNKRFVICNEFEYPNLVSQLFKKMGALSNNQYILVFKYDEFFIDNLDSVIKDLKLNYYTDKQFTCHIVVITEESNQKTRDFLDYEQKTQDSKIHITMVESLTDKFYFKLPYMSTNNKNEKFIISENTLYNIIIGSKKSKLPKRVFM